MVGRARFGLATNRLRGDCSTAELATQSVRPEGIGPSSPVPKTGTLSIEL